MIINAKNLYKQIKATGRDLNISIHRFVGIKHGNYLCVREEFDPRSALFALDAQSVQGLKYSDFLKILEEAVGTYSENLCPYLVRNARKTAKVFSSSYLIDINQARSKNGLSGLRLGIAA